MQKKDCLIVSCSAKKNKPIEPVAPAGEVYDGQMFRMIRAIKPQVDWYILSAEYGIIRPDELIGMYNKIMSVKQAGDLLFQKRLETQWEAFGGYETIYLCMPSTYMRAIAWMRKQSTVVRLPDRPRGIGDMMSALKHFCEDRAFGVGKLTTIACKRDICNGTMVIRKRGIDGTLFLGCSNYPRCMYTEELPESIKMQMKGAIKLPGC